MADVEMTDAPKAKGSKVAGGDVDGKKRFEVKKVCGIPWFRDMGWVY